MSLDTEQKSTEPIAWDWLKSISRDLYKLDETPLLGKAPPFLWEALSQEFAKTFSLEKFSITAGDLAWKEKDAITKGIASPMVATQITATGMEGSTTFLLSREDLEHVMAKVLQISEPVSELQAEQIVATFHRFLSIETVCLLNQLGYDSRVSFKITSYEQEIPDADRGTDNKDTHP